MARRYKRDKIGRFSGGGSKSSGTFKSGRKALASGKSARSDASMVKTLKGGEKSGGQISARAGRSSATTVRRRTSNSAETGYVGRAASAFKKDANKSKVKQRRMEKERKSLARKGARRGGK
jgi:hypothetical protein